MTRLRHARLAATLAAAIALPTPLALAQGELNIYSSRHYDADERIYSDFEEETGIKINRIEENASVLMERMKAEGVNSPADILITVDAARLSRADRAELFQPISSDVLNDRIPEQLRHPQGHYFAFSLRARVIFYDKKDVPEPPQTYQELADPKYKGMVCARSSSNVYMQSLLASIIAHDGEEAAKEWAAGLLDNFARKPQGGDTDQLRALVSGECDIAIANTYYFARAVAGDVKGLTGHTEEIGIVFPNQETTGAHVNLSGAGVAANAPNRENAIKFLEYLASPAAQSYFADANFEYPVVEGVAQAEVLTSFGEFQQDELPIFQLGVHQPRAVEIYDEVGYP